MFDHVVYTLVVSNSLQIDRDIRTMTVDHGTYHRADTDVQHSYLHPLHSTSQ